MTPDKLLTWVGAPIKRYTEIPQEYQVKFSWATLDESKVIENHHPVLCRDFLNDTLVWRDPTEQEDTGSVIYGYDYKGFVHQENTIFVLTVASDLLPAFEHGRTLLNKLEDSLGVERTRFLKTDNKNKLVSIGDSVWMKTTVHLSYYTALLRYMFAAKEEMTDFQEIVNTTKQVEGPIKTLAKYTPQKLGNIILKMPFISVRGAKQAMYMHDYNGFVSATNPYVDANVYSSHFKGAL